MAANPIKITDYNNKISSSRKEYLDEENGKIIGSKGFVFSSYKTEKQRLEEYLKDKNTINNRHNLQQLASAETYKERNLSSRAKSDELIQPSMRFKARTDLERLVDTVKYYSYGRVDTVDIINQQKKSQPENNQEESESDLTELDYASTAVRRLHEQIEMDKEKEKKKKEEEERNIRRKKSKRNQVENVIARQLMSDLHSKTHFKGATGYLLFKDTSIADSNRFNKTAGKNNSRKNNITQYNFNKNKLNINNFNKTMQNLNFNQDNSFAANKMTNDNTYLNTITTVIDYNTDPNSRLSTEAYTSKNAFFQTEKNIFNNNAFHDPEISEEIMKSNPLLYNLNINPHKKKSDWDNFHVDENKLQQLKNLAFTATKKPEEDFLTHYFKVKSNIIRKISTINNNKHVLITDESNLNKKSTQNVMKKIIGQPEYELKKIEDDKININGEIFWKNQVDKIAKKVLTGCNFIHMKNKNNLVSHKTGEGKMMITSGMTVNDFLSKHKFK